ncbi:CAP domain-containing protein [Virgibacillus byunsanensis]|uniref:CAP domain-containing protein n=1 Tax=Virgibacillus byunsanensis TaxID=570945 RepID=A0ABW3LNK4_9BACI
MIKNTSIIAVLTVAFMFGGNFQTTVDASENTDQFNGQPNTVQISINNLLNDYFKDLRGKWKKIEWNWNNQFNQEPKEKQPKEKEPKQEQPEKEVEEPKEPANSSEPETNEPAPKKEKVEAPTQPEAEKEQQNQDQNQSSELSQFEQEVVDLTNAERAEQGLSPLKVDTELSKVAREKSRDMAENNYFAHNSPNYGSPFDMMNEFGVSYRTAGENIAKGQRSPEEVVNAWMNSEGHRANILHENFSHIGVGFVEKGNHWTQQFIGK